MIILRPRRYTLWERLYLPEVLPLLQKVHNAIGQLRGDQVALKLAGWRLAGPETLQGFSLPLGKLRLRASNGLTQLVLVGVNRETASGLHTPRRGLAHGLGLERLDLRLQHCQPRGSEPPHAPSAVAASAIA